MGWRDNIEKGEMLLKDRKNLIIQFYGKAILSLFCSYFYDNVCWEW